jgi:hypothetical protein
MHRASRRVQASGAGNHSLEVHMRSRLTTVAAFAAAVPFFAACSDATAPSPAPALTVSAPSLQFGIGGGGGGGGGGGTGGGGTGGGGSTTPAPAPTSCATITSFSNSTGYYSVWAAIWTPFSFTSSCGFAVTFTMNYLNGNTGLVDFSRSSAFMTSGTIDEDWAAFSTPYTVTLTLTDPSGNVLDSRSALVTTKAGKTPGA